MGVCLLTEHGGRHSIGNPFCTMRNAESCQLLRCRVRCLPVWRQAFWCQYQRLVIGGLGRGSQMCFRGRTPASLTASRVTTSIASEYIYQIGQHGFPALTSESILSFGRRRREKHSARQNRLHSKAQPFPFTSPSTTKQCPTQASTHIHPPSKATRTSHLSQRKTNLSSPKSAKETKQPTNQPLLPAPKKPPAQTPNPSPTLPQQQNPLPTPPSPTP